MTPSFRPIPEHMHAIISPSGGVLAVQSVDEAYRWCSALATGHYENFPVASWLLPKAMRPHIAAVYAFARCADDAADEPWTSSPQERLAMLAGLTHLIDVASERPRTQGNPIMVALSQTFAARQLSPAPFLDLLEAFRRDVQFQQPQTWSDVLDYCRYSANPVGRLVLLIAGIRSEGAMTASDSVCTALQLLNFWQDLSIDVPRGRQYIPVSLIDELGPNEALIECIRRSRRLFQHGLSITDYVPIGRLRLELLAIVRSGLIVLNRCEELGERCWTVRPTLRPSDYLSIMTRVVIDIIRVALRIKAS